MTTWISSDYHLCHKNILKYDERPFKSLEEMQADCIAWCRRNMKAEDEFYYLGDLWPSDIEFCRTFIAQIPCKKIVLCTGNHDEKTLIAHKIYGLFDGVYDRFEGYFHNTFVVLSHYEHANWNHKHHGACHFFGHSHRVPELKFGHGRSMEVGYRSQGNRWAIDMREAIETVKNREV